MNFRLPINEGDAKDRILFNLEFKGDNLKIEANLADAELKEKCIYDVLNFSLYLDDRYVDLKKRDNVTYNGKQAFNKKLQLSKAALVEGSWLFTVQERIYPEKIEINSNQKKSQILV
ncbi:MAG: hypothetical protein ACI35Z_08275 [Sphingobacterium hotanense]